MARIPTTKAWPDLHSVAQRRAPSEGTVGSETTMTHRKVGEGSRNDQEERKEKFSLTPRVKRFGMALGSFILLLVLEYNSCPSLLLYSL